MNRRNILIGGGAIAALCAGGIYTEAARMGSMEDYASDIAPLRLPLPVSPQDRDLVRYATLAPNSHNTQAWTFRVRGDVTDILPDFTRRTPAVDPDDHHLFVSLGCAAENLVLASAARGRPGEAVFNPAEAGSVSFTSQAGKAAASALFDAIPVRQSTRSDYDGRAVSVDDLQTLAAASVVPGVDLVLLTERSQMDRVRDLVVAGNDAQMADPAFIRELKQWLRFSPHHAARTGDGLFSALTGNPALPEWLGPAMFDLAFKPKAENQKYVGQIASSSGIAVFVAAKDDAEHWMLAGRACQRFALQATALGLRHAFINQPVEIAALRPDLAALIGLPGRRPDIVMRFGYGAAMPYSARRSVDAVLV